MAKPARAALAFVAAVICLFALSPKGTNAPAFHAEVSQTPVRSDGGFRTHSGFQCFGTGSQVYDFSWLPQFGVSVAERPICLLSDVCMVDDELVYYEDPTVEGVAPDIYRFAEAAAGVRHGLFKESGPIRVEHGPLPTDADFEPTHRVHILDVMSDASNYGHLLLDTMLPAFAAADIFDAPAEALQIVEWLSCDSYLNRSSMSHMAGPNFSKNVGRCRDQLQRWVPALFSHPILLPPFRKTCFHRLIYGHSSMLNGHSYFPHRSAAVRSMRLALYNNLHLPLPELTVPIASHKVYVWRKVVINSASEGDPCAIVDSWALGVPTKCTTPALMDLRGQAEEMADATLVVTEDGSTTYGAFFFLRPGASLIVIGKREAHMLLQLTHINVYYITTASAKIPGEGAALAAVALDRAGRRLGIEKLYK